jgi:hydroxyacylglutathione hydrolase
MRGASSIRAATCRGSRRLRSRRGVTVQVEKILLTHGHIDHCGEAGIFASRAGCPIEGPHEADRFWISRLEEDGAAGD